jgi:protein MpaA
MNLCTRAFAFAFLLIGILALAPARADESKAESQNVLPVDKYVAGMSIEGRPIRCEVYGDGPDVMMVIATIHGNEACGTPLVAAFAKWLVAHPAELTGRTVVIVPVANPDGYAAGKRFNARNVDLNRNFPAGNWGVPQEPDDPESSKSSASTKTLTSPDGSTYASGKRFKPGDTPLSEPESRALMQLICRYYPNRILSIHQPVACIDYDGPAAELAAAMGAKCPLPVKQLGSRPGSLGSFVGNSLQKPIVTWEFPEEAGMDADELWKTYGDALIAALQFDRNSDRTSQH